MKRLAISEVRNMVICTIVVLMSCACSSERTPSRSDRIPALALRASPAAYALFQSELDAVKADNEFAKRAKDPQNYDVYIAEDADDFLFTFVMRQQPGERILDNRSVYAVRKKDGVATVRSVL